ncbi:hypothetical protein N9N26_00650 [Candidatus Poseidoniales archaeon]|jgi:hypothetical protein|nr:hypothetical protein [Candidatus Poseidoniales archaeon]
MGNPLSKDEIGDLQSIIDFCNEDMHEYVQFAYMLNDDLPDSVSLEEERDAIAFVEGIINRIEVMEKNKELSHLHLAYLMQELHTRGVANLVRSLNVAKDQRFRIDNV